MIVSCGKTFIATPLFVFNIGHENSLFDSNKVFVLNNVSNFLSELQIAQLQIFEDYDSLTRAISRAAYQEVRQTNRDIAR